MSLLILILLYGLILSVFLKVYRSTYFRSISAALIDVSGSINLVAFRPSRRNLRAVFGSASFVCLSPSYYAAFGVAPDCLSYDSRLSFSAPIYVFKRNRFGRFVSVDLSDRSFLDLLSKFSH